MKSLGIITVLVLLTFTFSCSKKDVENINSTIFIDTKEVDGQLSISEVTITDKLVHWGRIEKKDIIQWK